MSGRDLPLIIWTANKHNTLKQLKEDKRYRRWLKDQYWYPEEHYSLDNSHASYVHDRSIQCNQIQCKFSDMAYTKQVIKDTFPVIYNDVNTKINQLKSSPIIRGIKAFEEPVELNHDNAFVSVEYEDNNGWHVGIRSRNAAVFRINDIDADKIKQNIKNMGGSELWCQHDTLIENKFLLSNWFDQFGMIVNDIDGGYKITTTEIHFKLYIYIVPFLDINYPNVLRIMKKQMELTLRTARLTAVSFRLINVAYNIRPLNKSQLISIFQDSGIDIEFIKTI